MQTLQYHSDTRLDANSTADTLAFRKLLAKLASIQNLGITGRQNWSAQTGKKQHRRQAFRQHCSSTDRVGWQLDIDNHYRWQALLLGHVKGSRAQAGGRWQLQVLGNVVQLEVKGVYVHIHQPASRYACDGCPCDDYTESRFNLVLSADLGVNWPVVCHARSCSEHTCALDKLDRTRLLSQHASCSCKKTLLQLLLTLSMLLQQTGDKGSNLG